MHRTTRITWLLLPALVLMLGACREDMNVPTGQNNLPPLDPSTVMAVVQREPTAPSGTVRYTVRVIARDLKIAAYQGALTFTPGGLELVSLETPLGLDGEPRVVNTGEMADGRIRFAAFTADQFTSDRVFTATFRVNDPRAEASLRADLDVVGTPEGQAVASTAIVPSVGRQ